MATIDRRILVRMRKELKDLEIAPPTGVVCYPLNDNIVHLRAEITGPEDTPYVEGTFAIDIQIPDRYPFEPPRCQFLTRIYHPNIDEQGRICLDILKSQPKGTWGPAISITTMLISLRLLLANPNPDDPLLVDVADEFKTHRDLFLQKAREYTTRFATGKVENLEMRQQTEATIGLDPPSMSSDIRILEPSLDMSQQPQQQASSVKKLSMARPALRKPHLGTRRPTTATNVVTASATVSEASASELSSTTTESVPSTTSPISSQATETTTLSNCASPRPGGVVSSVDAMSVQDSLSPSANDTVATVSPAPVQDRKRELDQSQEVKAQHREQALPQDDSLGNKKQKSGSTNIGRNHSSQQSTSLGKKSCVIKEKASSDLMVTKTAEATPAIDKTKTAASSALSTRNTTTSDPVFTHPRLLSQEAQESNCIKILSEAGAQGGNRNKGKGKAVEETDENEDAGPISLYNQKLALPFKSPSLVQLLPRSSVPLTTARKRNLLKKQKPK
ncbi:Ubiquitin-conjugating enzyme E2 T [Mortierella polycephala]|uniref:E2 ubiquitin-conjugating enzyme n=1 Tax=Mortierella polycephala TaxID=41804 RepID=A0A9P6Q4S2_9FUNG|nr:Ubiquitin-conjugating enzyme E2 T [Mortierella polycephala]